MDKRFIVFIAISIGILFASNYFIAKPHPSTDFPKPTVTTENKLEANESKANLQEKQQQFPKEAQEVTISNQNIELVFSTFGAKLNKAIVRNYRKNSSDLVNLVDTENGQFLGFNAIFDGKNYDLENKSWNLVQKDKELIVFQTDIDKILQITKTIELNKNSQYTGNVSIQIKNLSTSQVQIQKAGIIWGPSSGADVSRFNVKQAVVFNAGKINRYKPKKKSDYVEDPITDGWIGMRDQYFCSIFYGNPGTFNQAIIQQFANQSLEITGNFQEIKLNPNEIHNYSCSFFFGPQSYSILKKSKFQLDKVIDFGLFRFIAIPMLYLLKFFFKITNNYGFSIILLTILIRAILWWPTQKSYTSMKKMQTAMNKMQPRLKTLKELYKDNPTKLNEETMKLYREYQVNPMGGCLPMLLQMPIFFALYSTLTSAVELKGANFMWIWKDLSTKDPLYILPIAMGLSMFFQQKMSTPPAATDEAAAQQKMMLYLLPAMLTFFSFMWPSGLLLYWVVSNVISIGQQVIINKYAK